MDMSPPADKPTTRVVHLAAAALAILSAAYYALYINAGFNYTDDGNYAQTAYELFLGRPAQDLDLSYGVLWYKAGALLFRLFGVDFLLVRLLFFGVVTLTTVLVFYCLVWISRSVLLAVLLAGVLALVPAFPATAFYGLCVAINAAAQLRLATRLKEATIWDGALAGTTIAASFQIRPDFGFIFMAPAAFMAALLFWPERQGNASRVLAGLIAGFAAVALIAAALAFAGGYGSLLAQQYLAYPRLLAGLLLNGFAGLGGPASDSLTLLRRPGLSDPAMASLVYLPLVAFGLAAAYVLFLLKMRLRRNAETVSQAVVALTAGAATFPHYFFYRPDLSHIANFMPGFVLMTGVFLGLLRRDLTPGRFNNTFWLGAAATAAYLALYVREGLPSPATGSIAVALDRTERFTAENGVDVRVTPDELTQLAFLRDTVEANSRPGDAIVCLPYCPGVAFMTGRRMLLHNFYVDDTFLQLRPQWLSSAIAETEAARPPVVIVQDWAINGTEQSRFANWAASYVDAVKKLAHTEVAGPATTVYLTPHADPSS